MAFLNVVVRIYFKFTKRIFYSTLECIQSGNLN